MWTWLLSAVSVCPSGNTSGTQIVFTHLEIKLFEGLSLPLNNDTVYPPFL